MNVYQIEKVAANAPEELESLGSKDKFWFGGGQRLFKAVRNQSGEDWAERVTADIAGLLGLPHAQYELAVWERGGLPVQGVVSQNFCSKGESLILGNELLAEVDPGYSPGISKFRVSAHTVSRVLGALEANNVQLPLRWTPASEIRHASELFLGYLMLDALVGNTDRHHENWGILSAGREDVHLAPTFDHASSLGCHEVDEKRRERLHTRDRQFAVEAYAAKARSALYRNEEDKRPLLTQEAFLDGVRRLPAAGKYWLGVLGRIREDELAILVDKVPADRISATAAEFAQRILASNKRALLDLWGSI